MLDLAVRHHAGSVNPKEKKSPIIIHGSEWPCGSVSRQGARRQSSDTLTMQLGIMTIDGLAVASVEGHEKWSFWMGRCFESFDESRRAAKLAAQHTCTANGNENV